MEDVWKQKDDRAASVEENIAGQKPSYDGYRPAVPGLMVCDAEIWKQAKPIDRFLFVFCTRQPPQNQTSGDGTTVDGIMLQ